MRSPFVVRVPDARLAAELTPLLADARGRVEVGSEVAVGLPEAAGPTRWIARHVEATSASDIIAFLERWGFVARATR